MSGLPRWHTQRCGRCQNSRYLYGQRRGLPLSPATCSASRHPAPSPSPPLSPLASPDYSRVGKAAVRELMRLPPISQGPFVTQPACMRAATNPGLSGHGNGRMGVFSAEFIRKQSGCPVEVLHYHDASLRKESLLRELGPARKVKAALRAQRRLEVVARHEARRQLDADQAPRRHQARCRSFVSDLECGAQRDSVRASRPWLVSTLETAEAQAHPSPLATARSCPRQYIASTPCLRRRWSCRGCGGDVDLGAIRLELSLSRPSSNGRCSSML